MKIKRKSPMEKNAVAIIEAIKTLGTLTQLNPQIE